MPNNPLTPEELLKQFEWASDFVDVGINVDYHRNTMRLCIAYAERMATEEKKVKHSWEGRPWQSALNRMKGEDNES